MSTYLKAELGGGGVAGTEERPQAMIAIATVRQLLGGDSGMGEEDRERMLRGYRRFYFFVVVWSRNRSAQPRKPCYCRRKSESGTDFRTRIGYFGESQIIEL